MSAPDPRPENRLAREKSPYLRQHATNPVDWYPWGDEAFARARELDRPVFLSIGYSTCHWCHVMERESFENVEVAGLLNEHFVCVKVDREERPDIDRIYMAAAQAMGVGGGWPLNLFLTPERQPFFGGTYFPPVTRGGRTGLVELLPRVQGAWLLQRDEIVASGARVLAHLAQGAAAASTAVPADALAGECVEILTQMADAQHGGFGEAPKFPSPANLAFLLRWWARAPHVRVRALGMATHQLAAMCAGGLHDQLGGGFHRYATDRAWRVPHFEKMLYDQALIADALLDAWQVTRDERFARAARGTFAYVLRDLTSPDGAFWAAEDADSEGEEGRFYVWTPAQLAAVLGESDAALAAHRWGVTPQGNFEHGASVLHLAHDVAATARRFQIAPEVAAERLERARAALLASRAERPRPHRDEKVLASWNGLMIAALARGARALGEPALAQAAARAAEFVWRELRDPASGALHRRWCEGEAAHAGQLDDHAYVAHGLLALFASTHEVRWLERAAALTERMVADFADPAQGGCFESPAGDPSVPVRMKDGYDGAELAGNSIATANLVRLSRLLQREDWRVLAERSVDYHARRLAGNAWAMPQMLAAMDLAAHAARHVVIAGEPSPERDGLLAVYEAEFRPFDDLVVVDAAARGALAALAPFTASLYPKDGRATAYVCVDHVCRLPVTAPAALAEALNDAAE